MIKCMFQGCACEATNTIPCTIGPKELKEDIQLCDFHFNFIRQPEPFVSVSIRSKGGKIKDD